MDVTRFSDDVAAVLGAGRLIREAPLRPLTTFRVGGAADWFVDVRSDSEVREVLRIARAHGVPVTILGGGSNVVVSDLGVRGIVIRPLLSTLDQPSPGIVRAGAGVTINGLVRWTIGRGLAGLEAWAGTPGTVGGAVYGNAHWQRRNIGDFVREVLVALPDGGVQTVRAEDMGFAYDTSRLQRTGEVVISADIRVSPGEPAALRAVARQSLKYRKDTQPLASPSAGCVFQNPDPATDSVPEGLPASAGALVDRVGLKGHRVGGARISDTHANFIVNDGGATAEDIRSLVETARRAVRERLGVELRDEIVWLGAF